MKAVFPAYTSELMRGAWQIQSLWSEELKPKWSAFTPTGCFKRIIYHDWSNLAPPFLPLWGSDSWKPEFDEGEESEQTAPWRPRQDRGPTQNMFLSSHPTLMDPSWVKDEELSTNTLWNPGLTGCIFLFSNALWCCESSHWGSLSCLVYAFQFNFQPFNFT